MSNEICLHCKGRGYAPMHGVQSAQVAQVRCAMCAGEGQLNAQAMHLIREAWVADAAVANAEIALANAIEARRFSRSLAEDFIATTGNAHLETLLPRAVEREREQQV